MTDKYKTSVLKPGGPQTCKSGQWCNKLENCDAKFLTGFKLLEVESNVRYLKNEKLQV